CLDSIVTQTLCDIEIILVNDGSTDRSREICQEFSFRDSRIRVIDQDNSGPSAARNAGLNVAEGEYIGFVDSDDWIEPHMYERLVQVAMEHDCDIVWANVYRNESEKQQRFLENGLYERADIEEKIFPRLLAPRHGRSQDSRILRGSTWMRLYRHDLIRERQICFVEQFHHNEDQLFNFECTIHANRYFYLGEDYLYHHRLNINSLSQGYVNDMWSLMIKPLVIHLQEFTRSYSKYDFTKQMDIRVFTSSVLCIDNEVKVSNPNSLRQRLRVIRVIIDDPLVREALPKIDTGKMKRINRAYYWGFRLQLPLLVYGVARWRHWRQRQTRGKQAQ
ncbi:glycosyltransferase, partial [bacterium]|nr:glycosyltransferase [bacterium]